MESFARSQLVKVGEQVQTLKLLEDRINLEQGLYNARYDIEHYSPETGERAIVSAKFNDIKVTVKQTRCINEIYAIDMT